VMWMWSCTLGGSVKEEITERIKMQENFAR
jgi:hypothetical protein